MPLLTPESRKELAQQIHKMFDLQDRKTDSDKIALFVQEIEQADIPLGAILNALREISLSDEIKQIKLGTVFAKARCFIEPKLADPVACNECNGLGLIIMVDENKYPFAFACRCENGTVYRGEDRLLRWNGEDMQFNPLGKKFFRKVYAAGR